MNLEALTAIENLAALTAAAEDYNQDREYLKTEPDSAFYAEYHNVDEAKMLKLAKDLREQEK